MLLATINWFQIPYVLAFVGINEDICLIFYNYILQKVIYILLLNIMNAFIDVAFIVDVVINFRTSYVVETTGIEITNLKVIAINYLKGKFTIDFLASLPLDMLSFVTSSGKENSFIFQILGLLKLVRVLRLSKLITYLNLKTNVKMSLKLAKLIFFIVMFVHWLACVWFYIVVQDYSWWPPLDDKYIVTQLYEMPQFTKYWVSKND